MSSQSNISDMPFDQKSLQPPEEGVLRRHRQTDRQTNRLTDITTLWLNRPSGPIHWKGRLYQQYNFRGKEELVIFFIAGGVRGGGGGGEGVGFRVSSCRDQTIYVLAKGRPRTIFFLFSFSYLVESFTGFVYSQASLFTASWATSRQKYFCCCKYCALESCKEL